MRAILGILVMALSGFFVIAALADLITGGDGTTEPGIIAGLLVFFLLVGYAGYRLYRSSPAQPLASPEQRILALATQMQGRVTLAEVVLHSGLEVPQARELMKRLVRQGLAELYISDGGEEVYAFGGLMPQEKQSAKDPFH